MKNHRESKNEEAEKRPYSKGALGWIPFPSTPTTNDRGVHGTASGSNGSGPRNPAASSKRWPNGQNYI
jgi:hypothetical protein